MSTQPELKDLIRKTIALYNRYRSPEATAKLVSLSPEAVTIAFQGSFCRTCGVQDYLEDFIYEFKAVTSKAELRIQKIKQTSPESYEVNFKIKTE